jgi:hypothetical protein
MKRYIFIALVCLIAVPAFATRQIQDKLNYEETVYEIGGHTNFPLEDYFRSCPEEQRKEKYRIFSSRWLTVNGMVRLPSTGCRRGYVATWNVETNMLYLTKVVVQGSEIPMNELKPIFGEKIKDHRLQAFWFNGPIRIKKQLLVFEAGKLIKTLSPDKETINKVYKDLIKKKYSEQRKKDSQQSTAPVPQKAAQSASSSVR